MKIIIALSLLAASLAVLPVASAECVETACVDASSYGYGTCDDGYAWNGVGATNYDSNGYVNAGAGTNCAGYPGYYEYNSVGAGFTVCDASWSCQYGGASWGSYRDFGWTACWSEVYVWDGSTYTYQPLPLCAVAGAPPGVPALA